MINNPASTTLPPRTNRDLEIDEAIRRAGQRIAFGCYFRYLSFELLLFSLKARLLAAKVCSNFLRLLNNSAFYVGAHVSSVLGLK